MRNLFYENSLKMKSLNEENFQIFQGIQKHVFLHQKDIVKANILLSTILDQMNDETQKINLKKV